MNISKTDIIAGLPALEARKLFRKYCNGSLIGRPNLMNFCNNSKILSKKTIKALIAEGYLDAETYHEHEGEKYYHPTSKAKRVASASAAKAYKRSTGEKALVAFLERCEQANNNQDFLYSVESYLFGSMLTDKERVSDVDLAVRLHLKPEGAYRSARKERVLAAIRNGRFFQNFVAEEFWPMNEVLLFLKARSPVISIVLVDDDHPPCAGSQIVYQKEGE